MHTVERAWDAFARRRVVVVAVAVVLGLAVRPRVFDFGFTLDDYAQLAMLSDVYPVARGPFDLFTFSDGSSAEVRRLVQVGFYPWFAHPALRLSMWRPLSSALTWCDFQWFGLAPLGHHVHSALWWVALVTALAFLLGRVVAPGVAAAALFLFVLDETHGVMLGWLANRNAITSATAALFALGAHLRWREQGWHAGRSLSLVWYALSLLMGEYALCFLGYFVAYESLAAPAGARARVRALAPVVALAVLYLVVRAAAGYGSYGSDMYIDPWRDPGRLLAAAPGRFATLLSDVVLAVRADWWTFGFPWMWWFVARGWAPEAWLTRIEPWRATQEALGVVALAIAWLVYRAATGGADREARRQLRWLGAGALLALVPLVAGFPSVRLLVAPVIGWCLVLAAWILRAIRGWRAGAPRRFMFAACAGVFGAYHVVVPALYTWHETSFTASGARLVREVVLAAEVDEARLPTQRVVLLSGAEPTAAIYGSVIRRLYGRSAPRSMWSLNWNPSPFVLHRPEPATLIVQLHDGMLDGPVERMFRARAATVRLGQRFVLDGLTVTLLALRGGLPTLVRFDFDRSLDDDSWVFLHPQATGLRRFPIPPVGGMVEVPSPVPYTRFRAP